MLGEGPPRIVRLVLLAIAAVTALAIVLLWPGDDRPELPSGLGNDSVDGGAGNDIIFGGDKLNPTPPPGTTDDDTISGGLGNDSVHGGARNDIIFGSNGDDYLTGATGMDQFEGGSGLDTIVETADADITLSATQLFVGGFAEQFYDIERAVLTGGAGSNWIDANGGTLVCCT